MTGSTGLKYLLNFPSLISAKELFTVFLKSLVLIGRKSSLTSRMCYFLGMNLSTPTLTRTGQALSLMAMRPNLESMGTAGIIGQIKKQITVGVTELSNPINIPIGMTIEPGNLNDQTHFKKTYKQSNNRLREGSLVIFDKGANSIANTQMIRADNL